MASSPSLRRKRPRRTSPPAHPASAGDDAITQAMSKMSDAICVVRTAELVLDDQNTVATLFDRGEASDAVRALNVGSKLLRDAYNGIDTALAKRRKS